MNLSAAAQRLPVHSDNSLPVINRTRDLHWHVGKTLLALAELVLCCTGFRSEPVLM